MAPITLCSPERVKINHKNTKIMRQGKETSIPFNILHFHHDVDFPKLYPA